MTLNRLSLNQLFGFAIAAAVVMATAACTTPLTPVAKAMGDIGFVGWIPPQKGIAVLSVIAHRKVGGRIVGQPEMVCNSMVQFPQLLAGPFVVTNPTTTTDSIRKLSADGKLSVDPSVIQVINTKLAATANAQRVKSVTLNINNASITEIDDTSLIDKGLPEIKRKCAAGINAHIAAGNDLRIIKAVYVADVSYIVESGSSGQIDLTGSVPDIISAELGAKFDSSSKSLTSGGRLVYGVKWPIIEFLQK